MLKRTVNDGILLPYQMRRNRVKSLVHTDTEQTCMHYYHIIFIGHQKRKNILQAGGG